MEKLNVFQDKAGKKWVTWLGTSWEKGHKKAPLFGIGETPEASSNEFMRKLSVALKTGKVVITLNS